MRLGNAFRLLLLLVASVLAAGCGSGNGTQSGVLNGRSRVYYIAADEVPWDYAPTGSNQITGEPFDEMANMWVASGPHRIGRIYKKALYREYTDASFAILKPRAAQDQNLGILGPILRAEVGDTIQVVFRNNATHPFSIHPHGVFYDKSGEGSPYADGTNGAGAKVEPGQTYTYRWSVPERAGPGPSDPSSVVWAYHSHVTEMGDINAGLVGAIVVTRQGMARLDGSPKDVDREVVSLFLIENENLSPYLQENINRYCGDPKGTRPGDSGFVGSNQKYAINGYLYGNQPMVTLKQGQRVRWYVMGLGSSQDLHTAHWHGATVLVDGTRKDVIELLPATFRQADMIPDVAGIWLFHCHVNDHMMAGMMTRFQVLL